MPETASEWIDNDTVDLDVMRVTLSEPVLVGRRRGYFWFPNLWTMPNGDLLSTISPVPDIHLSGVPYLVTWSQDGGLTWSDAARLVRRRTDTSPPALQRQHSVAL